MSQATAEISTESQTPLPETGNPTDSGIQRQLGSFGISNSLTGNSADVDDQTIFHETSTTLETIMSEAVPILELGDDDFEKAVNEFVAHRIDELSGGSSELNVGLINGATDEFIDAEIPMFRSGQKSREYFLDDNEAYTASFKYVRALFKHFLSQGLEKKRAYLTAVIHGTNSGQVAYFESYFGNEKKLDEITHEFMTDDDTPEERISIADLKGAGVCLERASITHNALKIFGINSRLETGRISVVNEDGSVATEQHAFITFEGLDGKKMIYDPTNPKVIKDSSGVIVGTRPSLYPVLEEGSIVTGNIIEFTKNDDGQILQSRSRQVTYDLAY